MIPCELVVKRVLPVVRRQFVERLSSGNKKQREIALELGLTEAAVSQYLSEKRACCSSSAEKSIALSVEKFFEKNVPFGKKACLICKDLRETRALCKMHVGDGFLPNKNACGICATTC